MKFPLLNRVNKLSKPICASGAPSVTKQDARPGVVQHNSAPNVLSRRNSASAMLDKPYKNKPNLGTHTYAAGARNAQIQSLAQKLKQEMTPGGLYGIGIGAAIGAGVATAISFAISFLSMVTFIVPGLGVGLFLGVFVAGTVIGAIVQFKARKAQLGRPEVQLLLEQLQEFSDELQAIPIEQRDGADVRDLREIQALQSHMTWSVKQAFRQMGYGILGVQSYAKTEEFCVQQYRKIAALGRSQNRQISPSIT